MSSLCSFKRFLVQNENGCRYYVHFQSAIPPPPKKKKRSERHIVFRCLSKRLSEGLCLEGLTRLLLKSKDSKSSVNTRQRVASGNVYFKASQSVLATVFSITCLFACEEVLHQLTLVFGFPSPVFSLWS